MKIERDGNSFTIQVAHAHQAETLEALLKTISLTMAGPPVPHGSGSMRGESKVAGLSMTLNLHAETDWDRPREPSRQAQADAPPA